MLSGVEYPSAPVKLERKKIYGWSSLVATDKQGQVCSSAYLSPDDALIIPSGGYKQGTVDNDGRWVDKAELTAYGEDGNVMPTYQSSFDGLKLEDSETRIISKVKPRHSVDTAVLVILHPTTD